MRIFILLTFYLLGSINGVAQTPEAFQYQAVVRDAEGEVIANQAVQFRMSILQAAINGNAVYTELHSTSTNSFGLATLQIGDGITTNGNFSEIEWGSERHFVQVEIDETGGTNFRSMGTTQLLAVPYALHAKKTDFSLNNITSLQFPQGLGGEIIEVLDTTTIYTVPEGKNLYISSLIFQEVTYSENDTIRNGFGTNIEFVNFGISMFTGGSSVYYPIISENTRIKAAFTGFLVDLTPKITPVILLVGTPFDVPNNSTLCVFSPTNTLEIDNTIRIYSRIFINPITVKGGSRVEVAFGSNYLYGYLINEEN